MKRPKGTTPRTRRQPTPIRTEARNGFLQDLLKRKEILLSVQGHRTGRTYTFPVWFVVQGETLWLLPVRGKRTHWYLNLGYHPALTIRSGHLRRTFVVHPIDQPRMVASVLAVFRKKHTANIVAQYYPRADVAVEVPLNPRYSPATA